MSAAAGFQAFSGTYTSNLARHPDEPAHFITGLMVYDYIRDSLGANPLAFAGDYYVHYPKVGFGHWPPVFYFAEALAFFCLAPKKSAVLLLALFTTILIAVCLYGRLRRYYGASISFLTAMCFLTMPLVRGQESLVLADLLTALFVMLAVFALADFLLSGQFRHCLCFGVWSSLALLTKGNAAFLALLPPFVVLATRKFQLLMSWKFWFPAVLVLIVSGPYYVFTTRMFITAETIHPSIFNFERFPTPSPSIGVGVLALAALGALGAWRSRFAGANNSYMVNDLKVSLASLLSFVPFLLVQTLVFFPLCGPESRYFLIAVPALMILFAGGLFICLEAVRASSRIVRLAVHGLILLLILYPLARWEPAPVRGYEAVVDSISYQKGTVVLISSGSMGEGAFVVEQRMRDPRRETFVLRASKALSTSTWNNQLYNLSFSKTEELRDYLNRVPVHFIVLDDYGYSREPEDPHHQMLRKTLQTYPQNFILLQSFPITHGKSRFESGILLYENRQARGRLPGEIRVDLQRNLGREVKGRNATSP
jgi:hypothetical protein